MSSDVKFNMNIFFIIMNDICSTVCNAFTTGTDAAFVAYHYFQIIMFIVCYTGNNHEEDSYNICKINYKQRLSFENSGNQKHDHVDRCYLIICYLRVFLKQ